MSHKRLRFEDEIDKTGQALPVQWFENQLIAAKRALHDKIGRWPERTMITRSPHQK